jgi:hypothetical protein
MEASTMFPENLFDAVLRDYTRRARQINCFGWMRENISRAMGGRRRWRNPEVYWSEKPGSPRRAFRRGAVDEPGTARWAG